ncbi:transcriptional regulator [Marinobacterium nitratireducens]|uniref:Transcriptional regulator n=1 Tax=Marinobacterium nitratireducens TaxID=518897 RepID=A0A918DPS2_9GAMM|nr:LysR substrate-binding domain-containing protein [Marinobacterium nitratireducens]GGO79010.1 transcriptional regulator [Marinobacterium nitratireducens]
MAEKISLPPLATLQAFEAAARLGNFTAAARELDSTQSAISQHIRRLEQDLGVPLFHRQYRGVRLTESGGRLLEDVSEGLARLASGIASARQQSSHDLINVGTDFALAAYWLLPRLARFRDAHPEVEVRVVTAQKTITPDEANIDIAILFGDGHFDRAPSRLLMRESVVPVCSPALLERYGPIQSVEDLNRLPLLQLEAEHEAKWFNWSRLFERLGIAARPREPALVLNNYTLLLQAAIAGQGAAIGWRPMVDSMLESGLLLPAIPQHTRSDCGYYLVLPSTKAVTPMVQKFCDWLIHESQTDSNTKATT